METNRKDFNAWLYFKPDWKEVAWEYNTGRKYQSKQDLAAIFWNAYIDIEKKAEAYYLEFSIFPLKDLQELVFRFKQCFSDHDRIEGIKYFDELIQDLITKHGKVRTRTSCGFKSDLTEDQIKKLYKQLIGSYIEKSTSLDQFKAIFKPDPLPPGFSIKWLKSNVLLAYVVKKLFYTDNPFDPWKKADNIFGVKNLRISAGSTDHPKGEMDIDQILKTYTGLNS